MSDKSGLKINCGCAGCLLEILGILGLMALWNYRHEIWEIVSGGLK